MITYVCIAAMILLLVGMLVIKKTMASSPMLQPLLFLCVALELGLVIFVFYNQLSGGGTGGGAIDRAIRREEVKAIIVGKYLKEKASGKKTVIVCSFGTKDTKIGKAFLETFNKNYGDATLVELKENPDGGTGEGVPLKDVEEALKEHKDAELIVFYGSTLPQDYKRLSTGKATYFLFEQGAASVAQIKRDIDSGKIIGIVLGQPNPPKSKEKIEKDDKEAFDKRYLLIDKGNIGAHAEYFKE